MGPLDLNPYEPADEPQAASVIALWAKAATPSIMNDETMTSDPQPLAPPAPAPPALAPPVPAPDLPLAQEAQPLPPAEATPPAPVAGEAAVSPTQEPARIGRFLRSELEAMRGKRGRKPAEYHLLFPDHQGQIPPSSSPKSAAPARRRAPAGPRVSSAVLGDHSIDELLAKAGTTGAKPAAYFILVKAAEHLAAAGAVHIPIQDDLARQVAEAPVRLRRMIQALLTTND